MNWLATLIMCLAAQVNAVGIGYGFLFVMIGEVV